MESNRGRYPRTPEHKKLMSKRVSHALRYRKTDKTRSMTPKNIHARAMKSRIRGLSTEAKWEREQTSLWHKLHSIFTRKEFIVYEYLPKELQDQIHPFEEFIYPSLP